MYAKLTNSRKTGDQLVLHIRGILIDCKSPNHRFFLLERGNGMHKCLEGSVQDKGGGGRQLVGMSPFPPPNPHQNFTYEYTIVYIFCKALPEMLR